MAVLMGAFVSHDFDVRYVGIDKKMVEGADWGVHRRYALLSVQPNLESAVRSFDITSQ